MGQMWQLPTRELLAGSTIDCWLDWTDQVVDARKTKKQHQQGSRAQSARRKTAVLQTLIERPFAKATPSRLAPCWAF